MRLVDSASDPATPDVVDSVEEAAALGRRPPLLVVEPLVTLLDAHGLGEGPLEVRMIGGGHSNATFAIARRGLDAVLRRPPRPPLPPGAHDVVREGVLLRALAPTAVPTPAVLLVHEDPAAIGAPFVVMERCEGEVISDRLPEGLDAPGDARALAEALLDVLIDVHAVGPATPGLEGMVRPGSYLERQLRRFRGGWEANRTRALPSMDELGRRLAERAPEQRETTLVHGDFRFGNALVAGGPPRITALLDWEMAALGDPLADLGYLHATWTDRGVEDAPYFHQSPVTAGEGFPTRDELVERYARRTGRDVSALHWYAAFALWKFAVFMEGNLKRALEGMSDDPWALGFRTGVPELAELGLRELDASPR